jgi:hypothetical protein
VVAGDAARGGHPRVSAPHALCPRFGSTRGTKRRPKLVTGYINVFVCLFAMCWYSRAAAACSRLITAARRAADSRASASSSAAAPSPPAAAMSRWSGHMAQRCHRLATGPWAHPACRGWRLSGTQPRWCAEVSHRCWESSCATSTNRTRRQFLRGRRTRPCWAWRYEGVRRWSRRRRTWLEMFDAGRWPGGAFQGPGRWRRPSVAARHARVRGHGHKRKAGGGHACV